MLNEMLSEVLFLNFFVNPSLSQDWKQTEEEQHYPDDGKYNDKLVKQLFEREARTLKHIVFQVGKSTSQNYEQEVNKKQEFDF